MLLTDIEMPRESGLEFLEWMKEQGKEYKAICMTCHAEFDYAKKALGLGVMEYLVKPVNREELVNCVKKLFTKLKRTQSATEKRRGKILGRKPKKSTERFLAGSCDGSAWRRTGQNSEEGGEMRHCL